LRVGRKPLFDSIQRVRDEPPAKHASLEGVARNVVLPYREREARSDEGSSRHDRLPESRKSPRPFLEATWSSLIRAERAHRIDVTKVSRKL
jgi:hypothetical protein